MQDGEKMSETTGAPCTKPVLIWDDGSERMRGAMARAEAQGREVVFVRWECAKGLPE